MALTPASHSNPTAANGRAAVGLAYTQALAEWHHRLNRKRAANLVRISAIAAASRRSDRPPT